MFLWLLLISGGGGFNTYRNHVGKIGLPPVHQDSTNFNSFVGDARLIELSMEWRTLTWSNRWQGKALFLSNCGHRRSIKMIYKWKKSLSVAHERGSKNNYWEGMKCDRSWVSNVWVMKNLNHIWRHLKMWIHEPFGSISDNINMSSQQLEKI